MQDENESHGTRNISWKKSRGGWDHADHRRRAPERHGRTDLGGNRHLWGKRFLGRQTRIHGSLAGDVSLIALWEEFKPLDIMRRFMGGFKKT
jgi:hypothetical protein